MKRTCEHCGVSFETARPEARFCTRQHKNEAANLEAARGKQLYRSAMRWRGLRSKDPKQSNDALAHLTWLLAQFIDEDKEAGLPIPPASPGSFEFLTTHKKPKRDKGARERAILDGVLGSSKREKADA